MIEQYRINRTVGSWILTMVFVLAGLYLNAILLSWRWAVVDMLKVIAILSPLVLVAIIIAAPVWVGLALGALPLVSFSLPIPVLHRISPPIALAVALAMCVVAHMAIAKQPQPVLRSSGARIVTLVGVMVALRFLYDRPGSSSLGATGGAGEAFMFGLAFLSFWTLSVIAASEWNIRLNFKTVVCVSLAACVFHLVRLDKSHPMIFFFGLFHRAEWLLSAVVFAWFCARYQRRMDPVRRVSLILCALGILFASVLSAHRSRPIIAIGIIFAISFVYGWLRGAMLVWVCVCGVLIGGIALSGRMLPPSFMRALSTVIAVPQQDYSLAMRQLDLPRRYRGSAELGWHSDFRRTMNALAWRKIRRHPIVGNGFAFTREELVAVVGAARRGGLRNAQEALATSGGYHNTLIQMAVICGIPTVLLFVIAFVAIPRRFAMLVRSVADPQTTVFAALLLGFFVASSVQMLTNGSGVDLFVVCCLLGIMNGIMYRIGKHRQHVASSSSPRERSAASK